MKLKFEKDMPAPWLFGFGIWPAKTTVSYPYGNRRRPLNLYKPWALMIVCGPFGLTIYFGNETSVQHYVSIYDVDHSRGPSAK